MQNDNQATTPRRQRVQLSILLGGGATVLAGGATILRGGATILRGGATVLVGGATVLGEELPS